MARNKPKPQNPISAAVEEWISVFVPEHCTHEKLEGLIKQAPKRWVVYEPMVLLPSGSFASPLWREILAESDEVWRNELWKGLLCKVSRKTKEKATHLAVNDGIPLTVATHSREAQTEPGKSESQQGLGENILRSPTGLRILYGDFGPPGTFAQNGAISDEDFDKAFWVSTKQNRISQTWAPRWTMFSRGNIKEKARLLAFHGQQSLVDDKGESLSHRIRPGSKTKNAWAVDLYAGIGYFVFSYAKLGMKVLCWELNPWSVEGLRRGAQANGWSVRVVQGDNLKRATPNIISEENNTITVFLENNQEAARRISELRSHGFGLDITHINCGLLPKSDDSWKAAWDISGEACDTWLHLHENVGAHDIKSRQQEIQALFNGWSASNNNRRIAKVEHVELVKTFAPDVWHCVFDIYITSSRSNPT